MDEFRRWETGEALPESYNAKESPVDMRKGTFLPTSSGVKVESFGWLSEETMNFNVTAAFTVAWTDPRLANLGGRTWIPVPAHVLWLPVVKFGKTVRASWHVISSSTQTKGFSDEEGTMTTWLSPEGQISHSIRRKLSVSCLLDLRNYPFDKQTCGLQLHGFGGIVFQISPVPSRRNPVVLDLTEADSQFVVRETELLGTVASTRQHGIGCTFFRQKCMMGESADACPNLRFCDVRDPACKKCSAFSGTCTEVPMDCNLTKYGGSPDVYSTIEVRFHFKRRLAYYVLQTFIPTTTVVVVSWSSFWLHYNEVSARITIGSTTLLMLIRLGSQTMRMPHISYIRAIDIWHIGCLVFVLLVTLEFAVVHFIHTTDGKKENKKKRWNTTTRRSRVRPVQSIAERIAKDVFPEESEPKENIKQTESTTKRLMRDDNGRLADRRISARERQAQKTRPVRPATITAGDELSKNQNQAADRKISSTAHNGHKHISVGLTPTSTAKQPKKQIARHRKISSTTYNGHKKRSVGPAPTSTGEQSKKQISTADYKIVAKTYNGHNKSSVGQAPTSTGDQAKRQISTAWNNATSNGDNEKRSAKLAKISSQRATKKTLTTDQATVARRRYNKEADQNPSLVGERSETVQPRGSVTTRPREKTQGAPCSIDVRSRQVFPMCFLLFALTYWLYYEYL
ncbi:gamma-aminobutyric acid receptor subunit beta-1-like [Branchiostoma lanceolatum]|uniref:gamma-aminobutyric acid receptor subunit beta-1-like n=1 Tax=Branchiostoma lanceolatum TaxID=7740 RepID=UPI00345507B1